VCFSAAVPATGTGAGDDGGVADWPVAASPSTGCGAACAGCSAEAEGAARGARAGDDDGPTTCTTEKDTAATANRMTRRTAATRLMRLDTCSPE